MTRKEYTFDAGYQPQVRAPRGTSNIMLDVIIALIPAICVGVWQFGFKALIPVCTSVLSCVFFEWAYRKLLHKHATIGDLSAVVTGLLLAMTLPANALSNALDPAVGGDARLFGTVGAAADACLRDEGGRRPARVFHRGGHVHRPDARLLR